MDVFSVDQRYPSSRLYSAPNPSHPPVHLITNPSVLDGYGERGKPIATRLTLVRSISSFAVPSSLDQVLFQFL